MTTFTNYYKIISIYTFRKNYEYLKKQVSSIYISSLSLSSTEYICSWTHKKMMLTYFYVLPSKV